MLRKWLKNKSSWLKHDHQLLSCKFITIRANFFEHQNMEKTINHSNRKKHNRVGNLVTRYSIPDKRSSLLAVLDIFLISIHVSACNIIKHETIRYYAIGYDKIQYAVWYNTIRWYVLRNDMIRYNTIQYNAIQYNAIQCNKT